MKVLYTEEDEHTLSVQYATYIKNTAQLFKEQYPDKEVTTDIQEWWHTKASLQACFNVGIKYGVIDLVMHQVKLDVFLEKLLEADAKKDLEGTTYEDPTGRMEEVKNRAKILGTFQVSLTVYGEPYEGKFLTIGGDFYETTSYTEYMQTALAVIQMKQPTILTSMSNTIKKLALEVFGPPKK